MLLCRWPIVPQANNQFGSDVTNVVPPVALHRKYGYGVCLELHRVYRGVVRVETYKNITRRKEFKLNRMNHQST